MRCLNMYKTSLTQPFGGKGHSKIKNSLWQHDEHVIGLQFFDMWPVPESPMRDQDTFRLPRWAASEPPGCIWMHLDAGYELRHGATVNWEVQNLDGSDGLWQSMAVYGYGSIMVSYRFNFWLFFQESKHKPICESHWISTVVAHSLLTYSPFEKLQHIHQDTCMPRSLVVVAVVAAGSVPVPLSDLSEERPGSDRWPQWHWMHSHSQRPELPRLPTASSSAGNQWGWWGKIRGNNPCGKKTCGFSNDYFHSWFHDPNLSQKLRLKQTNKIHQNQNKSQASWHRPSLW